MKRRNFMTKIGSATLVAGATLPLLAAKANDITPPLNAGEIQHMVIFDLGHPKDSEMARKFLNDGRQILSKIPVVHNFQVFDQVSLKNDYCYGFSMVFENQPAYTIYNNHPDHQAFVENRWKKEVTRFLEIDFKTHE